MIKEEMGSYPRGEATIKAEELKQERIDIRVVKLFECRLRL